MGKYFNGCKTAEEVKKLYHKLAKENHPDNGGSKEVMQEINAEFAEVFNRLKNIHKSADGETYEKETAETAEEYVEIINQVIHLAGISIEICGSWIWITGNTYPVKDAIKAAGFRFSRNKAAWYWHSDDYSCRKHRKMTLDEIRLLHGSEQIKTSPAYCLS